MKLLNSYEKGLNAKSRKRVQKKAPKITCFLRPSSVPFRRKIAPGMNRKDERKNVEVRIYKPTRPLKKMHRSHGPSHERARKKCVSVFDHYFHTKQFVCQPSPAWTNPSRIHTIPRTVPAFTRLNLMAVAQLKFILNVPCVVKMIQIPIKKVVPDH